MKTGNFIWTFLFVGLPPTIEYASSLHISEQKKSYNSSIYNPIWMDGWNFEFEAPIYLLLEMFYECLPQENDLNTLVLKSKWLLSMLPALHYKLLSIHIASCLWFWTIRWFAFVAFSSVIFLEYCRFWCFPAKHHYDRYSII